MDHKILWTIKTSKNNLLKLPMNKPYADDQKKGQPPAKSSQPKHNASHTFKKKVILQPQFQTENLRQPI